MAFWMRLFQLQVIKGDYYWKSAERNRIQYYHIPAPRGRIFDRNGTKLVGNQPRYSLYVALHGLSNEEKDNISAKICELTGYHKNDILKKFKTKDILPFKVIKLISHLDQDKIAKIEENSHNLQQTSIQVEPRRKYPFGKNGSHMLGYIGKINKKNFNKMKKYGYKLKDKIGKCGIERVYDKLLRGRDGLQEVEVGVTGSHKRIINTQLPAIGNDLLLTIDWDLQKIAKDTLGDRAGAVIAMDPSTGEILVWLSQPGINPEDFTIPLSEDKAREIFHDPKHPLFDRVIQGQYAPGSLFKLITSLAALEDNVLNIEKEFTCNASIMIGYDRRVFRCWKNKKHGKIKLQDAIANSCNVYFYQLGMYVGMDKIYKVAKKMNLGEYSQDIFDKEKKGLIPNNKWKRQHIGAGWYPGDTANMSVGQGYVLVNPMQLLKMISAIAMEGKMYSPYILKMVIDSNRNIIEKNIPRLEKDINISSDIFRYIKEGMRRVTEYGTAQFLNLPLEIASKSGTAENPSGDDHAWFACFAPINKPRIAIVVLVENGGYGSVAAMPVAREILREKFLNPDCALEMKN